MLKNNNNAIIAKMVKRSFRSKRYRNITLILAVMLSAFLTFSVLTLGAAYIKMQNLQELRLQGAEFDAVLYGITEEQKERCTDDPDIVRAGFCAVSGYAAWYAGRYFLSAPSGSQEESP